MIFVGSGRTNIPYKMTTRVVAFTMAFTALSFAPSTVHAQESNALLDCECPLVRIDDAYCAATWVFEGVPLSTDTIFSKGSGLPEKDPIDHVDLLFRVERALKGSLAQQVIISTSFERDECAFRFILGTPYLVFARAEQELMVTDRCTPTRAMETIGRSFVDSLEYVRSGHQWEGHVPLNKPCN